LTEHAQPQRRLIEGRSIRWDEARARAAYADGLWVREGLGDASRVASEQTPERVLIVDGDVRIDASTLFRQASVLARWLLERAAPGSVVSFMLPNWHEAAVIYLATHLAGMVANPILPSLRDRDLAFILNDLQSRFIFIPAQFRNHDYAAMLTRIAAAATVVVVRGRSHAREHVPYAALFEQSSAAQLPTVDPDGVRLILYTSGTTGTPKGVMHSQNSIHALIEQLRKFWHIDPGDRFLVASPISHIGGSIYTFECPLLLGTTAVLADKWDPTVALTTLTTERITHMAGATPFLQQLLTAAKDVDTRLHGLKVFICGGASVPPALIRNAAEHFDRTIFTRVYGSTEVPVTTVGSPDRADLHHAAETDGRVGFGEVKLVEGEIRARGPQMLLGYVHPDDEKSVFDNEGYYRTGDLGSLVDGSYLVVSGRSKDIIIRKGENISPKEVEDCLVDHPNVAEVAIVGLPDAERGERACAAIVPKHRPGPGLEEIKTFLKQLGIASFKIPEQVVLLDALPRNDAGKVLKHVLRTQLT
jgi:acyl-CoA synthetase (AMP-forming)/AMP-acid ligase II